MKKFIFGLAIALVLASASSASAYTYTRDLTLGATGADVVELQSMLVAGGYMVMPAGVSMGYYGALTQSSVAKWQMAVGITPAAGYFGPISRAKASSAVVVTPGTPSTPVYSGDEGDIDSITVLASPSNEDVSEGESVKVYGFEVEATDDSDLTLTRVDVVFDGLHSTKTKRHSRIFETMTLYMGSDEIASVDVDSSSDWSEVNKSDDKYRVRFTKLDDAVIKAGGKAKFYVEVTAQDTLSSSDYQSGNDFEVYVPANGLRFVDEAGIDIIEKSTDLSSKNIDVEDVTSADITISESDDNPDTTTVIVDEDKTTDGVTLLVGEIETEDDGIALQTVRVYATSSIAVYSMVSDMILEIDGEEFSGDIASTTALSTYYEFDIDGDIEIDEDDTVEFVVLAEINKNATGTLAVAVTKTGFVAESLATGDDVVSTAIAGTADGDTMTMALIGVDVDLVKKTIAVTSADGNTNDYSTATLEIEVTNNGSDTIYVPLTASASTTVATTAGINFLALSQAGTSTIVVSQVTDRSESSNSVKLQKGQSATIEVVVTFLPGVAMTSQKYELSTVRFSETPAAVDQAYTAPDTNSYKTSTVTIVN